MDIAACRAARRLRFEALATHSLQRQRAVAEHEGEALAAAIATNIGGELFYVYGASSNVKRNLMPNYAMQMAMIRWGLETNCKTYNFGGVLNLDPNNRLYKFKIGFCREEGLEEYIGEINVDYNSSQKSKTSDFQNLSV